MVLPVLQGFLQGLLAVLLFVIPSWALKGSGQTIDDMGVDLGPWARTLLVSLVCGAVIFPPFALGFHLFHTQVTGAEAAWSFESLERYDEALLDAPDAPCASDRERVHAWIAGQGLWLMAPPKMDLSITFGEATYPVRKARCLDGVPRAGPNLGTRQGMVVVSEGTGIWLDLEEREQFALRLQSSGAELSADSIAIGARGEPSSEAGFVHGTRGLGWLLPYLIVHLGIVALPEEWFFRGYLQTRLDERWGTRWRFLEADLGWGFVVSALCFALLHPILLPGFHRLLVFFPALLFGYLRARTGNIGAAVVIHATSNLLLSILVGMYDWP